MGKINIARVILGGLLAGLVMNVGEYILNIYVMAEQSSSILARLGLPPIGTNQIIVFFGLGFVIGIVLIWLYAGIRPRFGAGIKTAIIAGVTVWLLGLPSAVGDVIVGIVPANVLLLGAAWGLVETSIAAAAGAWLYQESA